MLKEFRKRLELCRCSHDPVDLIPHLEDEYFDLYPHRCDQVISWRSLLCPSILSLQSLSLTCFPVTKTLHHYPITGTS